MYWDVKYLRKQKADVLVEDNIVDIKIPQNAPLPKTK